MQYGLLSNFSKEEQDYLFSLLDTCSPSGSEGELMAVVRNFLADKGIVLETDSIGNLYISAEGYKNHRFNLMLTAHGDEVGFQVSLIDKNGFVYLRRLGGVDRQTMPASKLNVVGKDRDLIGVFGKKPPHIQSENEKSTIITQESLFVDFGFKSIDEAKSHISIGDYITLSPDSYLSKNKSFIISKGLDNKINVFVLSVVFGRLAMKGNFPKDIVGVITVQEEIGCRGSIIASQKLSPKIGVCLDVGIATDTPPLANEVSLSEFKLGKGFGLCISPENNSILVGELRQICKDNSIPYQDSIGFRPAGGTETSRIQLQSSGIVTAHISMPNRYMHSTVEMCSLFDTQALIDLLFLLMNSKKIKEDIVYNVF